MRQLFIPIFFLTTIFILMLSFTNNDRNYAPINAYFERLDTLSDSIEVIDTIATYDPNDYSEKIVIIKRKVAKKQNADVEKIDYENMEFSGKMTTLKDTMSTYNSVTKEETLMITSYDLPEELVIPIKTMSAKEANKLKIKFAKNKKTETQTKKKKK